VAEAAAEERLVTALAQERAGLQEQARGLLCSCGRGLRCHNQVCRELMQHTHGMDGTAVHATDVPAWGTWWWSSAGRVQACTIKMRHALLTLHSCR
jgi:hypothetical protein